MNVPKFPETCLELVALLSVHVQVVTLHLFLALSFGNHLLMNLLEKVRGKVETALLFIGSV